MFDLEGHGEFVLTGAKRLPNRNSLEGKPLTAIIGSGACSIFVLVWIY
jgi:hypothetical protein